MGYENSDKLVEQTEENQGINSAIIENVEASIKVCPRCKTSNDGAARFCNKCGWDFNTSDPDQKTCPKCGLKCDSDAKFCLSCGYKFERNIKKKIIVAVCVALVLAAAGSGTTYYLHQRAVYEAEQEALRIAEEQRQEQIRTFQSEAKELYETIDDATKHFSTLSLLYGMAINQGSGNTLFGPSFFVSYVSSKNENVPK